MPRHRLALPHHASLAFALLLLGGCERPGGEAPPSAGGPAISDTLGPAPSPVYAGRLAVTLDDLPWVGPLPPGEDRARATSRLLAAMAEHGVTAVGFVDCARVEPGAATLRLWLEGGHVLGNHTEDHVDLNRADPSAWAASARRCDAFLRELTGEPTIWFRYPYLHRGPTRERYRAGVEALTELGASVAPVTIVTLDWVLAGPYARALHDGDSARAAEIGEALVDHVARATAHYQEAARARVGRDVAHILLLHANALAADYIGAVLERLAGEGFEFVTLEAALDDPVYELPDDYIGPEGLSWLYRFEPAAPELAEWDEEEMQRLRARFPR